MSGFDLLVLGEINPDVIVSGVGEPVFGQAETLVEDARSVIGGSGAIMALRLVPRGPELTTVVTEFLFRPETIADPNFDHPPVTDFVDLVSRQDWEVCERAQVGTRSRGYRDGGVYPYNDRLVHYFNAHYRSFMRD